MSIFTENKIYELYETNHRAAADKLKQIPVYCGNEPSFTGLNGWVFEQTIQYCIKKELKAKRIKTETIEQAQLGPHNILISHRWRKISTLSRRNKQSTQQRRRILLGYAWRMEAVHQQASPVAKISKRWDRPAINRRPTAQCPTNWASRILSGVSTWPGDFISGDQSAQCSVW
jgi:hypothetical protein